MWALLFTGKGGSYLNCKAAKVSSSQEPRTQSGPRPVTERLFKTAPYPLAYLVRDIHGFYNGPSP